MMVVLFFLSVLEFVSATRHTLVVIGSGTGSNLALGYEAPLEIERYVTDGAGRAVKLEPEERSDPSRFLRYGQKPDEQCDRPNYVDPHLSQKRAEAFSQTAPKGPFMASQPFHNEWEPANWNEFRPDYLGDQGYLIAGLAELTKPSALSTAMNDEVESNEDGTQQRWTVRLLDSDHEGVTAGGTLAGRVRDSSRVAAALASGGGGSAGLAQVKLVVVRVDEDHRAGLAPEASVPQSKQGCTTTPKSDDLEDLYKHLRSRRERVSVFVGKKGVRFSVNIHAPHRMLTEKRTPVASSPSWILEGEEMDRLLKDFVVFPVDELPADEVRLSTLKNEKQQMWGALHVASYASAIQDLLLQTLSEHDAGAPDEQHAHITLLAVSKGVYQLGKFFRELSEEVRATLSKVHLSVVVVNGGEGALRATTDQVLRSGAVQFAVTNSVVDSLLDEHFLDPNTMSFRPTAFRLKIDLIKHSNSAAGPLDIRLTDFLTKIDGVPIDASNLQDFRARFSENKKTEPNGVAKIEVNDVPLGLDLGIFDLESITRSTFLGEPLIQKLVVTAHEGHSWYNTAFGFLLRDQKNRKVNSRIFEREPTGIDPTSSEKPTSSHQQHVAFYTVSDSRMLPRRENHTRLNSLKNCFLRCFIQDESPPVLVDPTTGKFCKSVDEPESNLVQLVRWAGSLSSSPFSPLDAGPRLPTPPRNLQRSPLPGSFVAQRLEVATFDVIPKGRARDMDIKQSFHLLASDVVFDTASDEYSENVAEQWKPHEEKEIRSEPKVIYDLHFDYELMDFVLTPLTRPTDEPKTVLVSTILAKEGQFSIRRLRLFRFAELRNLEEKLSGEQLEKVCSEELFLENRNVTTFSYLAQVLNDTATLDHAKDILEYAVDFPLALLGRPYIGFTTGKAMSEQRSSFGGFSSLFGGLVKNGHKHGWIQGVEEIMEIIVMDTKTQPPKVFQQPAVLEDPGALLIKNVEEGFEREVYPKEETLRRIVRSLRTLILNDKDLQSAAPREGRTRLQFADRFVSEASISRVSVAERVGVRVNQGAFGVWIHFGGEGGRVLGFPTPGGFLQHVDFPEPAGGTSPLERFNPSPAAGALQALDRAAKLRDQGPTCTAGHYRTPAELGLRRAASDRSGRNEFLVPRVHHWRLISENEKQKLTEVVSREEFTSLEGRIRPLVGALRERVTLLAITLCDAVAGDGGGGAPANDDGRLAITIKRWWAEQVRLNRRTSEEEVSEWQELGKRRKHSKDSSDHRELGALVQEPLAGPVKSCQKLTTDSEFLTRFADFFVLGPDKSGLLSRAAGTAPSEARNLEQDLLRIAADAVQGRRHWGVASSQQALWLLPYYFTEEQSSDLLAHEEIFNSRFLENLEQYLTQALGSSSIIQRRTVGQQMQEIIASALTTG